MIHRTLLALAALLLAAVAAAQPARSSTRGTRSPEARRDRDGNLILRNEHLVAVVERGERGYGEVSLYPASRPGEPDRARVAVVPALAQVSWEDGGTLRTATFAPAEGRISGGDRLTFTGVMQEGEQSWRTEAELWIGPAAWLSWRVAIRPSAPTALVRFVPMPVRVAAPGPHSVLFPGVLYRDQGNALPAQPVGGSPMVPSPFQVTIPLMAVTHARVSTSLMWDMKQSWGGAGYPQALFQALPAEDDSEFTHRMELAVPEGSGQEKETEVLPVAAGQEIRLSGKIGIMPEEDRPAWAVREWVREFGQPIMKGYPRSFDAERRLAREAYLRAPAGETVPSRLEALALLIDAGLSSGTTARQLREEAAQRIARLREDGVLDPILAYRVGGVIPSLSYEREQVEAISAAQLANGGWPQPTVQQAPLSPVPPEPDVALVMANALPVLRYAAHTGNSTAAGAGLRALAYITGRYRVPHAAARISTEDRPAFLLTAAAAAEGFLLGYRISGEREHLESARAWADAGLPFVYFWGTDDRPAMQHAALPAIPSRYDETSRPAARQADGLVFARVLRALARVRPDGLYDFVSEGIVASAMRQQWTTGENAGMLPEYWNVAESAPSGAELPPDLLLAAMYPLADLDLYVSTRRVRVGPDRLFVASGTDIHEADPTPFRLRMRLKWQPGEETFTTITGVLTRPVSVEYNSNPLIQKGVPLSRRFLPEVEDDTTPGWWYDEDDGLLVLRLRHAGDTDNVEIRWTDPRFRSPTDRVDPRVRRTK